MLYFSYNDFIDCTENREINEIIKVEEKIAKYEIREGKIVHNCENQIIENLREKIQLKIFLKEFFNLSDIKEIKNIVYCNNIKAISDRQNKNNIICKIEDKQIFIFIKVIETIDNNISYKMFEHSLNIIKKWNIEEKDKNKRYPIVIPIVIYTGKDTWNNSNSRIYDKLNYITYEDNRINFNYNMINVNNLNINDLKKMQSKIAKELLSLKYKYLQIN